MADKVSIEISKELYEKLERALKSYEGFNTVEELVEFILNEFVSEEEQGDVYSPEEEEEIKKRLKSLGYL